MSSSYRPRGLRDLNPDLLFGRKRRAPGSLRAMAAFLRAALRRLGEDRRTCCAELKSKLEMANKAVGIEAARRVAAEKEREDARKLAAKWEIEAQDLRDLATQEKARAHRLANDLQLSSLRLEKLKGAGQRLLAAASPTISSEDLRRVLAILTAPADPDPRAGRPGPGADLLATPPPANWTADDSGASNSSPAFLRLCDVVERIIRGEAHDIVNGRAASVARTIMANLAHAHGLAPTGRAAVPPPLEETCRSNVPAPDGPTGCPDPRLSPKDSTAAVPPPPPAAPEVKVRTVILERTPPFVPAAAEEVLPPHERVPDMRGPRGREIAPPFEPQIFAGHSGDMVEPDEETEMVCSRCGRPLDGAFIRDPDLGGDLHFDCAREARKAAARRRA